MYMRQPGHSFGTAELGRRRSRSYGVVANPSGGRLIAATVQDEVLVVVAPHTYASRGTVAELEYLVFAILNKLSRNLSEPEHVEAMSEPKEQRG